jgi:hypothetical protein
MQSRRESHYTDAMRSLALCLLAAGCGVQSTETFIVETMDCAVVNNFTIDDQPTQWNDCRISWGGSATEVLTVELTTSGTKGSFNAPDASWIRASVHAPVNGPLTSAPPPKATEIPSDVPEGTIAIDLPVGACGNIAASGISIDTMADIGSNGASFSIGFDGTCDAAGTPVMLTGGFIVSAAGRSTSSDLATVVGPLP